MGRSLAPCTSISTQLGATGCEGAAHYSGIIRGAHPLTSGGPSGESNVRPFCHLGAISLEAGHAMHAGRNEAVMCITFELPDWDGGNGPSHASYFLGREKISLYLKLSLATPR